MRNLYRHYFKWILLSLTLVCTFRTIEVCVTGLKAGVTKVFLLLELTGLFHDIFVTSSVLLLLYPLYHVIGRYSKKIADSLMTVLIVFFSEIHLILLGYFVYQLQPLDIFVFQHSVREIILTVFSVHDSFWGYGIGAFLIGTGIILYTLWVGKKQWSDKITKRTLTVQCCLLSFVVVWHIIGIPSDRTFFPNKSFFFYRQCSKELYHIVIDSHHYTIEDALAYQKLHPDKHFLNTEYPFVHYLDASDSLSKYFNAFDRAPNFVFMIVEGLNDDFIHSYRGVSLMPFLDSLSRQGLYWNRCFTLGERSYAVIPSILGGLPYGKIGFTLMETLPKHHSLVSVLKASHYYSTFFYGQGAWFHQKDRFFSYNDIDLIVDKDKFSDHYQKIIVGNDHFFWGYNDRDLFSQAMNVIDTSPLFPRLDIYFTGSMHTPFNIADTEKYNDKLNQLMHNLSDSDRYFFDRYKKYVKSILFVDDELRWLMKEYARRPEFVNTVFIITGDHPMTEIPIANSLKRYHVPLIIYSAALKQTCTFDQIVSHLDIYETILSFLKNYHIKVPLVSSSIGGHLFSTSDISTHKIPFMNGNRHIVDYYSENYYLSENELYIVSSDLKIRKSDNKKKKEKMMRELEIFRNSNHYVCSQDKLLSDTHYCQNLTHLLSSKYAVDISIKNEEFYDLIPICELPNKPFVFDMSCYYHGNPQDISLVYTLSSQHDSLVMWRNLGMDNSQNQVQCHFTVPQQNVSDTTLHFQCYIWNPNRNKLIIDKIKILIYKY
jgi:uncharacterized sulfatase